MQSSARDLMSNFPFAGHPNAMAYSASPVVVNRMSVGSGLICGN
jgi:hypothetical protein